MKDMGGVIIPDRLDMPADDWAAQLQEAYPDLRIQLFPPGFDKGHPDRRYLSIVGEEVDPQLIDGCRAELMALIGENDTGALIHAFESAEISVRVLGSIDPSSLAIGVDGAV